ncbi:hypothetical protein [Streptosporangium roseum]|uniref:hypothetical protein n=1 Tax=Streptosporangium roseum TaxID=2001 RepID=UPI0006915C80|nr:hypothetical protein [Streptosporangium roseum]
MLFAVLAVAAQLDRDHIRDKTLEGQQTAAARGRHGGRPKVIDDDMLTFALALRDKGVPVPDIAAKLTIKTGKNIGQYPSVASVVRDHASAAINVGRTATRRSPPMGESPTTIPATCSISSLSTSEPIESCPTAGACFRPDRYASKGTPR